MLGFRVSDRLGRVAWLRCDADHHGLAITPGPEGTTLHHHAWQTQDLGTLASYCDSLIADGLTLKWGPVRHGPGFNLATYLPDSAGGLVEVFADLLQIPDDAGYIPTDWSDEPNTLNLWGPPLPDDFLTFGLPLYTSGRSIAPGSVGTLSAGSLRGTKSAIASTAPVRSWNRRCLVFGKTREASRAS